MPDSIFGHWASFSAAVIRRFTPMMKRMGEIVQSVMIPFSRLCLMNEGVAA